MGFFDFLTGGAQKKAIQEADARATGYLNRSYDEGKGALGTGYSQANGYLDPYRTQGQNATRLFGDAIGANGADAQRGFYAGFQNDPGWAAQQQAGISALDRSAAARGGLYSGAQQKALYNYGQQGQRQAYNDRLNQLYQLGGQGFGAAGQQAGLSAQQGNALAGLSQGYGQNMASNAINYGNAMAQAANIGPQNLINGLSTLGGLAFSAFAPGAGGMTAAGNMGNALMRSGNRMSGGGMGFPTGNGWSTNAASWPVG